MYSLYQLVRWGTKDAEIKVPPAGNPGLATVLHFKAPRRSEQSPAARISASNFWVRLKYRRRLDQVFVAANVRGRTSGGVYVPCTLYTHAR